MNEVINQEIILLNEILPVKGTIEAASNHLAERIKEGDINPLEFEVKAKWLTDVVTTARKKIKDDVITEIQKSGKETTYLGAKVEVCETGTKYDYSMDEKWVEINSRLEPILKELKEQEERIKLATKIGADSVNTDTGEIIARKVIKTSETSTKVTLGK